VAFTALSYHRQFNRKNIEGNPEESSYPRPACRGIVLQIKCRRQVAAKTPSDVDIPPTPE